LKHDIFGNSYLGTYKREPRTPHSQTLNNDSLMVCWLLHLTRLSEKILRLATRSTCANIKKTCSLRFSTWFWLGALQPYHSQAHIHSGTHLSPGPGCRCSFLQPSLRVNYWSVQASSQHLCLTRHSFHSDVQTSLNLGTPAHNYNSGYGFDLLHYLPILSIDFWRASLQFFHPSRSSVRFLIQYA
jgi:hypothetical protein